MACSHQPLDSINKPKVRMIVPQITHFIPLQQQPVIPLPAPPLPILHPDAHHEPHHKQRRHTQQRNHDRKARPIKRGLCLRKDETGDNAAAVPESDLQPSRDGGFIFPAHVIRQDGPEQREGNVRARFDEVEGGVPGAFGDVFLAEEDDEADEG